MILCFSLISSRSRDNCLWWRPRGDSPCRRIAFWKGNEQSAEHTLGKFKGNQMPPNLLFVVKSVIMESIYYTNMIKYLNTITSVFLTFTFPSSVSPFSPSLYSCSELSGGRIEEGKHWQQSYSLVLNIFKAWILCGTLILQLGQLFAQWVMALLKQSLLLLHALHVFSQWADLSFMLHQNTKNTSWQTLLHQDPLLFASVTTLSPERWEAGRRRAPARSPPSYGGTPVAYSPAGGSASPCSSPLTWSCWCRDGPQWTPLQLPHWSPQAAIKQYTHISQVCLVILAIKVFVTLSGHYFRMNAQLSTIFIFPPVFIKFIPVFLLILTNLISPLPTMVLNSLKSLIRPFRTSAMRFLCWTLTSCIRDSSASSSIRLAC